MNCSGSKIVKNGNENSNQFQVGIKIIEIIKTNNKTYDTFKNRGKNNLETSSTNWSNQPLLLWLM